jgi:cytochrome c2
MKGSFYRVLCLLLLSMLLASCSQQGESRYQAKKRLKAARALAVAVPEKPKGEMPFTDMCIRCHKLRGKGGVIGPDLSNLWKVHSRDSLEKLIRRPSAVYPGTVMPSFECISSEEMNELLDYLLNFK